MFKDVPDNKEIPNFCPIAIVGMAIRFPTILENGLAGESDEKAFVEFLARKRHAFRVVPEERWRMDSDFEKAQGIYTHVGAFLKDVDQFDSNAFGMSQGEAEALDPQHRIMLELAWHSLDNAGISYAQAQAMETGVFVGASLEDYKMIAHDFGETIQQSSSKFLGLIKSTMAGRISYSMDLHGPSMVIDSSCSTGLLTVYQACKSLTMSECHLALAGSVNLLLHPDSWSGLCLSGAISPTGSSRPFDAKADGYVRGEGAAMFVLMPLAAALEQGMSVRGILRGGAVNHDGASNGLTAPNGKAQEAVIRKAIAVSGIRAERIGIIETHGTGTNLGDPIEAMALSRVFSGSSYDKRKILLMSLKSVTGHLESAAGCVGLARLILDSERGFLTGQISRDTPNPLIPWAQMPFVMAAKDTPWPCDDDGKMCAGISAFGMSGTNVHMIFEPAPKKQTAFDFVPNPIADRIIPFSACDPAALNAYAAELSQLTEQVKAPILARAVQTGRSPLKYRSALLLTAEGKIKEKLLHNTATYSPSVGWIFTGQGSQYLGMGRELYKNSHVFKVVIDACAEYAEPIIGSFLMDIILDRSDNDVLIHDPSCVQPTIFAVQAGLVSLWRTYLEVPNFMIGHSIGEIALAYSFGIISLKDGVCLAAHRGALMSKLCNTRGAMLAVALAPEALNPFIFDSPDRIVIAAFNAAQQTVLSGYEQDILALRDALKKDKVKSSLLPVSHAFHSFLMEPMIEEFATVLGDINFNIPKLTDTLFISTVTGQYEDSALLGKPEYWIRHLLSPVQFHSAIKLLLAECPEILLEIGSNPILSGIIISHCTHDHNDIHPSVFHSLESGMDDIDSLSETLALLFCHGADITWPKASAALAAAYLPPYPFQHKRFWWNSSVEHVAKSCAMHTKNVLSLLYKEEMQSCPTASQNMTSKEIIRSVWEKWLPVCNFCDDTDFFSLGGNSLIAAHIVMEIRRKLIPDFSMSDLLKYPTINSLNASMGNAERQDVVLWEDLPCIIADQQNRHSSFSLNDMQHAYWIGRRGYFGNGEVGIHVYFEIEQQGLDVERFRQAWHRLLERHDMLHAIVTKKGEQKVLSNIPEFSIQEFDLSSFDREESERILLSTRAELEHKLFDLAVWPQFDIRIHNLPNGVSRIHFAIDGWCVDGWSYQILFSDLAIFYYTPDQVLPELGFTFRDYVNTMLKLEETPVWKRDQKYWHDRLSSLPEAPVLPLKTVHLAQKGDVKFVRRECALNAEDWSFIKKKSGNIGISTAMVILSVYAETLSLWAEQAHFCINVPRFNRLPLHDDMHKVIGEFASFTVLEICRNRGQKFSDFVCKTQEQMWRDLDHSLYSGVKVLRELAQVRTLPKNGAMPYVFTMSPEQIQGGEVKSLIHALNNLGSLQYMLTETPQVWIDCQYHEDNGKLLVSWDSLDSYFPEGMMESMFQSFSKAIGNLAKSDQFWEMSELVQIPSKQTEQRMRINDTQCPIPSDDLYTLLAKQVKRTPYAEALVTEQVRLSYVEFKQRVDSLAAVIAKHGVKVGDRVALYQKNGWSQIVSVFAILACRAAYVPLDVNFPPARIKAILDDCGAVLILTAENSPLIPEGVEVPPIIFADKIALASVPFVQMPARSQSDIAYIIYTSGSTGTPKGVMISDRSVVNMLYDTNQRFSIGSKDRIFNITSLHHDLSVYDIFGGLCGGATLILCGADDTRNATHWLERIQTEHVTLWNSVPAMMDMLLTVAAEKGGIGGSLRLVILGGDWIPVSLPARLRAQAPKAFLYTIGGPTETTVWNIFHKVVLEDEIRSGIPYGIPAGNAQYFILDTLGRERPDYAVGEMHCAGEGLALGYWNNDELTQEKFFTDISGMRRVYATGDLGYWDPDGEIRFTGRNDGQVNVHGMRIETAEIEAVLMQNFQVSEAIVIVNTLQKLIGFVTLNHSLEDIWPGYFDTSMNKSVKTFEDEWERWERFFILAEDAATAAMQVTFFELAGLPPWTADAIFSGTPKALYVEKTIRQWLALLSQKCSTFCPENLDDAIALRDQLITKLELIAMEESKDNSSLKVLAEYYRNALTVQADIVRGIVDPLECLFAGGDSSISHTLYQELIIARCLHNGLREALWHIAGTVQVESLNIAEIGAGSGSTTRVVLDALKNKVKRYHFTDLSSWFLEKAEQNFAHQTGFSTGFFDLNSSADEKFLSTEALDIIIAVNSLHCAADLNICLVDLYSRLKEGGHLILIETTRIDIQTMATTGLIDGFHTYADFRMEQYSPLISCERWLELFDSIGFEGHAVIPEGFSLGENILIARRPIINPQTIDVTFLKEHSKTLLPAHMVPSSIHVLDTLPLTVNGKVDRNTLANMVFEDSLMCTYVPENDVEEKVFQVCRDIAPKLNLMPDVNLFEVGLNSLQATRLALKLGVSFNMDISATLVFEYPTLTSLTRFLTQGKVQDYGSAVLDEARTRARKRRNRRKRI